MSAKTEIQWTDATWNPVRGCTKVSAGCKNCYAEKFAERWRGIPGHPFEQGFDLRLVPEMLGLTRTWKKPKRIFVNSMSDLFHEGVPFEFIFDVWNEMAITPWHTYQILTKRPARMLAFFEWAKEEIRKIGLDEWEKGMSALPNVWLGVSVENQRAADERMPLLLKTPAAVRFLSCEPLLEAVDLGMEKATCSCCTRWGNRWVRLHKRVYADWGPGFAEPGIYKAESNPHGALSVRMEGGGLLGIRPAEFEVLPGIDWVIVGGESGHGARPMHPDWARSLRDQCQAAGVPFFFKQWGEFASVSEVEGPGAHHHFPDGATVRRVGKKAAGRLLDGREWNEFPESKGEKIEHG